MTDTLENDNATLTNPEENTQKYDVVNVVIVIVFSN